MISERYRNWSVLGKSCLWLATIVLWGLLILQHPQREAAPEGAGGSSAAPACVAEFDPMFPERIATRCVEAKHAVAAVKRDCKVVSGEVPLDAVRISRDARQSADTATSNETNVSNAVDQHLGGSISLRITLGPDGVIQGIHVEQSRDCREPEAEAAQADRNIHEIT